MHQVFAKLALATGFLVIPATAQAMLQTAIFRVPISGVDVTGIFGVPNRVFDTAPATLKFYFDNKPGKINPVYYVKLTAWGYDYSIVPTGSSYCLTCDDERHDPIIFSAWDSPPYRDEGYDLFRFRDFTGEFWGVQPPPFQHHTQTSIYFDIGITDRVNGVDIERLYGGGAVGGAWRFQVVNFVPEPASWAMMIAGFALIGTALRRQRVAVS